MSLHAVYIHLILLAKPSYDILMICQWRVHLDFPVSIHCCFGTCNSLSCLYPKAI